MRNILMLLATASFAALISTSTFAADAEGMISQCEKQNQSASDLSAAVNKCLDEKLQYDPSEPSE